MTNLEIFLQNRDKNISTTPEGFIKFFGYETKVVASPENMDKVLHIYNESEWEDAFLMVDVDCENPGKYVADNLQEFLDAYKSF